MESKTKNRKTREQVVQMVGRAFDGLTLAPGDDAVSELKEGFFNAAYQVRLSDDREVIVKIAPPQGVEVLTYEENIMETEVAAMRLARTNPAIPVPEIYYHDADLDLCDSEYFFMEKLTGENYGLIKSSLAPEEQVQIDQQIGAIIREINGFTGTFFGYPGNAALCGETWKEVFLKIMDAILEDGQKKNAEYGGISIQEIRDAVLKHAPSLEAVTTPRMVHWDAWDLNVFIKDGRVTGLLDFERVLWGDPLLEAQFRPLFGEENGYLRGYGKSHFTQAEVARCHLYTLHLGVVAKTECYYRMYETDHMEKWAMNLLVPALKWLQEN